MIYTQPAPSAKKKSGFLRYIHNFRGMAILIIVMGHVLVYLDWESSRISYVIGKTLLKDGTVYFVFIAGFLFQYLSKKYVYQNYLRKKLKYVLIPYFLVSIPAVIYSVLSQTISSDAWFGSVFSSWTLPKQIITLYLTGAHLYPLWFIPMIVIVYLISPLLIWLDLHPVCYWTLIALLPLSLAFPRPQINAIWQSFLYFLPVYILGMFASRYLDQILLLTKKYFVFLAAVSVLLSCVYAYQNFLDETLSSTYLYVNTLNREIQCFLLLYLLWHFDARIDHRLHQVLAFLANISFGLYFLHGYIISIYFKLAAKLPIVGSWLGQGNLMTFMFASILVTSIGILLVVLPQKNLGKNSRYVIGC